MRLKLGYLILSRLLACKAAAVPLRLLQTYALTHDA